MPIKNIPFIQVSSGRYLPLLPLIIINSDTNQKYSTFGIVDTGASGCCVPDYYAQILGHNLEKGFSMKGIGASGSTEGYIHTNTIEIYDFSNKLCYKNEKIPITFMKNLTVVLLGVQAFLENFELHIHYPKKFFSITFPSTI